MAHEVTLIPGDGIGPSVTEATLKVLDAADAPVEWDRQAAGMAAKDAVGNPLPDETVESIERTRVALKGPLTTPVGSGYRSVNVALRKEFETYANVRPARSLISGRRWEDVDLVVVRENTEGLYAGIEHFIGMEDDPQAAAESIMLVTRFGAERIVRYAFEYARRNDREKVTLVHKANILRATQGLILDAGREIAEEYEGEVEFEDRIIDNTAMQLVLDPHQFDVLVMENMFGDIISDEVAGLVGGLGFAPAANIGDDAAIFEPVHGSAPDIAGEGIANPTALLLSACLMLDHLGEEEAARRVRGAVERTLREGDALTPDVGGDTGTDAFVDAVIDRLGADVVA